MIPKHKRIKSKKITDSAKGQPCLVQLPGVCNFNPETTVFAHMNGAGMGTKASDLFGAYCCSDCHAVVDGAVSTEIDMQAVRAMFLLAIINTQIILLEQGLIKLEGQ